MTIFSITNQKKDRKWIAYPGFEGCLELRDDIFSFYTGDIKSFGPPLEDTVVDGILGRRIGEGETER